MFDMTQNKIFFKDKKENELCGILSDPTENKHNLIIIICHGLGTNKDSYTGRKLEDILNKKGISIFRIDLFGHGESYGSFDEISINKLTDSVESSISYLKKLGYLKIGLFGSSIGGVGVVIAASKEKDLVLIALKSPGMGQTSRKKELLKEDFENKIWIKASKSIDIPTLIVYGDSDKDIESDQYEQLANSINNSKFKIVKGADHGYSKPEHFSEMLDLISEFIVGKVGEELLD
jgi:pimeloyl-ACP methyl ester carboxylesterase